MQSEISEVEVLFKGPMGEAFRYAFRVFKSYEWPDSIDVGLEETRHGCIFYIVERPLAPDEERRARRIHDHAENVRTDGASVGTIEFVRVSSSIMGPNLTSLVCRPLTANCQRFVDDLVQKIVRQKLNVGDVLRLPMTSDEGSTGKRRTEAPPREDGQVNSDAVTEQATAAEDDDSEQPWRKIPDHNRTAKPVRDFTLGGNMEFERNMTRVFDLKVEATPERLGKWLLSETRLRSHEFVIEKTEACEKTLVIDSGSLVGPYESYWTGSPYLCLEHKGDLVIEAGEYDFDGAPKKGAIRLGNGRRFVVEVPGRHYTDLELVIWIEIRRLTSEHVQVIGAYFVQEIPESTLLVPVLAGYVDGLRAEMVRVFQESLPFDEDDVGKRYWGRPGLPRQELIYRLAKAQEGKEIRLANPDKRWKEIAEEIQWRLGVSDAGIKLLEDARHRLHRLEKNDPDRLLQDVAQWREKKER